MTRIPAFSAGDEATYKVALEQGVTGYGTNTPPVGPAANVTYILGSSPTGDWAGNAKKVACYISNAWVFLPASGAIGSGQMGLKLPAAASNAAYYFDGVNWTAWAAPTRPVDLQNSIDPFPQYLMRYEGGAGPGAVAWGDITGTLSAQTDLNSALSGKAASTHTHAQSDITNLTTDLAGKASTSHTHNASDINAGTLPVARLSFTKAELDTAVSDGNVLYVGDITTHTQSHAMTSTSDHTAGNWKVFYSNGSGQVVELGLGANGTYLQSAGASSIPTWATPSGTGDVTGQASSVDDEIALFSGTGGKTIKRATTTGVLKASSGVIAAAVAGTDYGRPYVHVSKSSGATTTGANTTPVSVTGAVFNYEANSTYRIWVMGRVNSTAATTGIGLHFDLSSAVTAIDFQSIHQLAAGTTGTLTGGHSIADDTSAGTSSGVPAGPLDVPITGWGLLVTGANTGTAQLRVRSETTAVTELMAGAVMVVEKLI